MNHTSHNVTIGDVAKALILSVLPRGNVCCMLQTLLDTSPTCLDAC